MFSDSTTLLIYVGLLFGSFIQEDAAVLTGATLATTREGETIAIFITVLIGLFISDIWKYWVGWFAHKNERARNYAEKKHVMQVKEGVNRHLLVTLLSARFIPLTRIPTYVACGYFKIPYAKFCALIGFTAILYVTAVFTIIHFLGELIGEKAMFAMPIIAVCVLLIVISVRLLKRRKANSAPKP
ncbi:MAG: DedA family protein [Maricaulaceae bacterium]